jgi:hypothetical protein
LVHRVLKDHPVSLVQQDPQALKVFRDRPASQVLKDLQALMVLQVRRVFKDLPVFRVFRVHLV